MLRSASPLKRRAHHAAANLQCGFRFDVTALQFRSRTIVACLRQVPDKEVLVMVEGLENADLDNGKLAAGMASGFLLRGYDFHKYRTQLKPNQKLHLEKAEFSVDSPKNAEAVFKIEEKVRN